MTRPLKIAHRGMPRSRRENTLASFSAALAAGADGIELDVHATRDGLVVVHHDAELGKSGESISNIDSGKLRMLDDDIPDLRAVCELVAGKAELFVEIKGTGIENHVLEVLRELDSPWAIHSFDHALIARIHRSQPAVRLGVLFEHRTTDLVTLLRNTGALDVWPHFPLVHESLINLARTEGVRVIPWTVNETSEAQRLAHLGVHGICSDDVRLLDNL